MEKEVLRKGNFIDASGKKVIIDSKVINELAKNFNSEKSVNSEGYRVPLFLGHPANESTAAAHGWIKRIFAKAGSLYAEFDKLTEAAEKAIKDFSFRDVSVSIYKNILQHIGLTNTPAVPGLADFQFENAHKEDSQIIKFSETLNEGGRMATDNEIKLTEEKKDLEVKLTAVQEENEKLAEEKETLTEEKSALEEEKAETEKVKEELTKENEGLKKKIEDDAKEVQLKEDTSFVENLCKEGKLKPADREATITRLTKYPTEEIEEGKTAKDLYKESLSSKGVELEDGEKFADGEKPSEGEAKLTKLTKEYMEKEKVDFNTATAAVLRANPELNIEEK